MLNVLPAKQNYLSIQIEQKTPQILIYMIGLIKIGLCCRTALSLIEYDIKTVKK